ncbi:App1 family protein [Olivibacter sitiensis]|uniref:App1 family protein n=1 Tax=Olivibacter sitiensis TaxID=376470 RepID=UPI0004868ED6|nr:App1 family protein [Olivibacter sitiensis]
MSNKYSVKLYRGYGHQHNMVAYGHAFEWMATSKKDIYESSLANMVHLLKLFMVRPFPYARLRLHFDSQMVETVAEKDGFFKFQWSSSQAFAGGMYPLFVELLGEGDKVLATDRSDILIPEITQMAFISDIDDTVLVSHSTTILKRMRELLAKNPYKRRLFSSAAIWYQLLASGGVKDQPSNPFFYVSSSEWNLYDNIMKIFEHNMLPSGVLLLSHLKRFREVFNTGRTKHESKKDRIARIMRVFPHQKFVLIGDNSQRDPMIYSAIVEEFPGRVFAIFIRNVRKRKGKSTQLLMDQLTDMGVQTYLFEHNIDAIFHSREIGLIQ